MGGFVHIFLVTRWYVMIWAGLVAAVVSTLIQILLWPIFTDDFPAILYRDGRLTAAIVLGGNVLPPPATFDAGIMLTATLIHFMLSITYAALLILPPALNFLCERCCTVPPWLCSVLWRQMANKILVRQHCCSM